MQPFPYSVHRVCDCFTNFWYSFFSLLFLVIFFIFLESVVEKERIQWKIPHLWYIVMAIPPHPIWDSFQFVLKGFLCCFHDRFVCNTQDIHNIPFLHYHDAWSLFIPLCFSPQTWHIYSTASSGHPYTGLLTEGSLLCFKPHPPHEPVWLSSKALGW